jgi:signal transduction histidine kinase
MVKNVIDNAIKFSPQGSEVKVEVYEKDDQVVLAITDQGPGIPDAEKGKIFERFYRVRKSNHFTGSGLGLSIVKWVIDLHQADILMLNNTPGGLRVELTFAQLFK